MSPLLSGASVKWTLKFLIIFSNLVMKSWMFFILFCFLFGQRNQGCSYTTSNPHYYIHHGISAYENAYGLRYFY